MRISWQWLNEAEFPRKNFHNFMLCNMLPEYDDINCTKQLMRKEYHSEILNIISAPNENARQSEILCKYSWCDKVE